MNFILALEVSIKLFEGSVSAVAKLKDVLFLFLSLCNGSKLLSLSTDHHLRFVQEEKVGMWI